MPFRHCFPFGKPLSPGSSPIIGTFTMALLCLTASAATFNVSTPLEFQTALDSAAANGEDDFIQAAAETYALTATLNFNSAENRTMSISGAGAGSTILDGGGTRQILSMTTTEPGALISIAGITFQNGTMTGNGGGLQISTEGAGIRLEDCLVSGCAATAAVSVGGGVMLNTITGLVAVVSCSFMNNASSANVGGLAIGTSSGTVVVSGCSFISNTVHNSGGSEYYGDAGGLMVYSEAEGASHAVISSNVFIGNSASGGSNPDGGGLMTYQSGSGSTLWLEANEFTGNTAGLGGGGCILRFNQSADVTVLQNVFTGNRSVIGSGGGALVYIDEGTLSYSGNLHAGNRTGEDGGGIWISHFSGSAQISNNVFTLNQATNNGGGLFLATDSGSMDVERNVFDSNSSGNSGGAMNMASGTGSVDARNNTFYNNAAVSDGGSLYVYLDQAAAQSDLRNNIFWDSMPNAFGYSYGSGPGTLSLTYSAVESSSGEPWFGTGCITNNPLFRNAPAGDFKLNWTGYPVTNQTKSPCIDSGDPASALDSDSTRADMGAYSFPQGLAAMGTPHWWLDMHALTAGGLSFDTAEMTDTDSDEALAWREYVADTNPTNSASVFRIFGISAFSQAAVSFTGSVNRLYTLCGCSDLAGGGWTNVPGAGPRVGAGGADTMLDTNDPPAGLFYRLRVQLP